MSNWKRIPEIKLPSYPDETPTSLVVGSHILFIGIHNDTCPSNPLEDCDGMGNIQHIDSRNFKGQSRETVKRQLWDDSECVIPLRYRDWGSECKWEVYETDEVFTSIRVARNTCTLLAGDLYEAADSFDPDWIDKIDGVWIPDQCTRDSYTGQDGLTQHHWMVKQAESACESYTDYCNGNVYGYNVQLHKARKDDDGDVITDADYYSHHTAIAEDSCWGFYGWDYFLGEVKDIVKSMLKNDLKVSRRAIAAAFKEEAAA